MTALMTELMDDEMHEAYGAMMHRGRVEQAQSAQPSTNYTPSPLPNYHGHIPTFRPGTPRLIVELRNARIERNISRKVVAFNAGLHIAHLGLLETGHRSPSFATAVAWANALGYELALRRLEDK